MRACWLLPMLLGCQPEQASGLTGQGPTLPWPNRLQVDESGHVDMIQEFLPAPTSPLPVADQRWRTGFPTGQTFVARLEGVDASVLPHWRSPSPGEGAVRLVDLDDERWLPCMAELDAWPDAPQPVLLTRPLVALTPGHRVAVVITTEAAPRPPVFDERASGRGDLGEETRSLLGELTALGMDADQIALAWDVPIADGLDLTRSALAALDTADTAWTLDELREGDDAAPLAFRSAEGTLTVTGILDEAGLVAHDDGIVRRTGTWETDIWVHVPQSVADAPAGSVPVMVLGHGIFGKPVFYLDSSNDGEVLELAEAGGYIVVATSFRGLSRDDLTLATQVAADFSRLPQIPARLVQTQVTLRALTQAIVDGGILDDPAFRGASGQVLASPGEPVYYGISLGGIEGALAIGLGLPVERAVLHVPGAMWSTMLDRSSNFPVLERLLLETAPDPADRQLLYAWSQLHWEAADPLGIASRLADGPPVLLQESLHDEQVPNLVTRVMARSAGFPAVGPVTEAPWGIERQDAPYTGHAWVQYDPQKEAPVDANRPADVTRAHLIPRTWPGHRQQTLRFLADGVVEHLCGESVCTPDNPGQD